MKQFLFCLLCILGIQQLNAQDHRLYWKYKDYDGAISVTVPGYIVDIGSWFLDEKLDRKMARKVNKIRTLVFSNDNPNPITERDMKKFGRQAKRRHLEDLVMVRDGKTHVRVMAKERRNVIRKVVVLVNTPDTFALVSIKGRLRLDDIMHLINKYDNKDKDKDEKPMVPDVIKIPVKRV
jgi:hypothetical protein